MKKKSLTFIEVMMTLCIASFLLAILFPYLKETMRLKKNLEEEKKIVFSKNYLQARLAKLLGMIQLEKNKNYFFEIKKKYGNKNLSFYFKSDLKKEEEFRKILKAELFLKNKNLILKIYSHNDKLHYQELLLPGVKEIDFIFCYADHGKIVEIKNQCKEKNLPFFLILKVKFLKEKEDAFFFRLYPTERLYDTSFVR